MRIFVDVIETSLLFLIFGPLCDLVIVLGSICPFSDESNRDIRRGRVKVTRPLWPTPWAAPYMHVDYTSNVVAFDYSEESCHCLINYSRDLLYVRSSRGCLCDPFETYEPDGNIDWTSAMMFIEFLKCHGGWCVLYLYINMDVRCHRSGPYANIRVQQTLPFSSAIFRLFSCRSHREHFHCVLISLLLCASRRSCWMWFSEQP